MLYFCSTCCIHSLFALVYLLSFFPFIYNFFAFVKFIKLHSFSDIHLCWLCCHSVVSWFQLSISSILWFSNYLRFIYRFSNLCFLSFMISCCCKVMCISLFLDVLNSVLFSYLMLVQVSIVPSVSINVIWVNHVHIPLVFHVMSLTILYCMSVADLMLFSAKFL